MFYFMGLKNILMILNFVLLEYVYFNSLFVSVFVCIGVDVVVKLIVFMFLGYSIWGFLGRLGRVLWNFLLWLFLIFRSVDFNVNYYFLKGYKEIGWEII